MGTRPTGRQDGTGAEHAEARVLDVLGRSPVVQGPDGAVYLLEDDRGDSQGRLLKLTPKQ